VFMIPYEHEFFIACNKGEMANVIRLYGKINNILAKNQGFIGACSSGNENIARWLYEQREIDYKFNNFVAHRLAKMNNRLLIVEWLESLP
jgi:hypothetical protein